MIGRRLQQYLILEKAGEGGMGVVWKARDTRLDRDVALKVLAERITDDLGRERFTREAKSASALNHPNIVTIHEIDSDRGVDFIAMEFIRGETLEQRLGKGPLDIAEVVACARQIADALACAHDAGIVHRDLKPGNIMLSGTSDSSPGLSTSATTTVKVLDFGLAKAGPLSDADEALTPTVAPLTVAGVAIGTPGYMSPEQALGDPVDARSDVFSFGVVLYRMVSGKAPFRGSSRAEVLRQLCLATPESLLTLRPQTPPELAAIIMRALEKNPADRFASMTEVRNALAQLGAVVETTRTDGAEAAAAAAVPKPRHHSSAARLGIAGVVAVLILGLGWAWWSFDRSAPQPTEVRTTAAVAAPQGSPYELTQRAVQLIQRHDRQGNIDNAIAILEEALKQDRRYAPAYAALADAYRRKNGNNPDPQWARMSAESARQALELNPDLAIAQTAQGFVDFDAGRFADAEKRWRRAIELDPRHAMPHLGLGMAYAAQSRDAEAEASFRDAISRAGSDWRPHSELASFYIRRTRFADAAASYEVARTLAPDNTIVWRNLGAAYFQLERHDDAASAFQRALEISPTAATYTNLGTLRFYQGRYVDAVPAFEKAVELGANRSLYWGNLADAYRWAPGRRADSIAAYERAIALLHEEIGRQPTVTELRSRLATYLVKANQTNAALDAVKDVAGNASLSAQILMHLAVVNELTGNRDRALQYVAQAIKAGYSRGQLAVEPELTALRADARYHRVLTAAQEGK